MGTPMLDAAAFTGSEGVEVVAMRGIANSVMVVVSRADPAFLADRGTTAGVMVLWRVAAADDEEAPLRGGESPSEASDGPATPAPRFERPGEVDLFGDVEALSEA